jgi:hypothetical protein
MTDQTVEETKDAGSDEAQVEQTDGSSLKDKVEDAFDSVKDKLTGGDKADDVDKADDKE